MERYEHSRLGAVIKAPGMSTGSTTHPSLCELFAFVKITDEVMDQQKGDGNQTVPFFCAKIVRLKNERNHDHQQNQTANAYTDCSTHDQSPVM